MTITHILGMPRIGAQRELKKALESYWAGSIDETELRKVGRNIRAINWAIQKNLSYVTVGDFSFYDHVLDMSMLLGVIPPRVPLENGKVDLNVYFHMARGRAHGKSDIPACEMTKWFDTNYHYIVPEFQKNQQFKLMSSELFNEIEEAKQLGYQPKPVLLGPLSFLWLGKTVASDFNKLDLLESLLKVYFEILKRLRQQNIDWVQIDEPILVLDLPTDWKNNFRKAYQYLQIPGLNLLLATYFADLGDNTEMASQLPVAGIHVDAIRGSLTIAKTIKDKVLSVGIIDGRNIWRNNLRTSLEVLKPLQKTLGNRLWLGSSCSFLHTPVDLQHEHHLDSELKSWLAFTKQKLDEIDLLANILKHGEQPYQSELEVCDHAIQSRTRSTRIHNPKVKKRCKELSPSLWKRSTPFSERYQKQLQSLKLPLFPTTTIGSFPQTHELRSIRFDLKAGTVSQEQYEKVIREQIKKVIEEQEKLGLDVLVHGEVERGDMVEYFGEQLEGFTLTENGWVQSFGSRYVKPPLIFGDIHRPKPMTLKWIAYAQSQTQKPIKGILTGPITMLHWSFVRDDIPFFEAVNQIAFAIRDEVQDLENAGIKIIQIDEPAFREALPLHSQAWKDYLDNAVKAFRIGSCGVRDETQIHTHMCYSKFNDIFEAIINLDADVITIESFRSNMEILNAFDKEKYPNAIGPGVYDIHSPHVPTVKEIIHLLTRAVKFIPKERLWANPDCGLKTRQWSEVIPSLKNMIEAVKTLRNQ